MRRRAEIRLAERRDADGDPGDLQPLRRRVDRAVRHGPPHPRRAGRSGSTSTPAAIRRSSPSPSDDGDTWWGSGRCRRSGPGPPTPPPSRTRCTCSPSYQGRGVGRLVCSRSCVRLAPRPRLPLGDRADHGLGAQVGGDGDRISADPDSAPSRSGTASTTPPITFTEAKRRYEVQTAAAQRFLRAGAPLPAGEGGGRRGFPTDLKFEAMLPVLEGKLPVVIRADRERAIREAIQFAEKQKIRMILDHGDDAVQGGGRTEGEEYSGGAGADAAPAGRRRRSVRQALHACRRSYSKRA